ncbi:MAG: DNA alkylation repair protein [Chloroflexota bacterium]
MTATEWVEEIQDALDAQEDRSTANLRKVRRGFSKRLIDADAELVLKVALRLVKMGQPYRWVAYELVHYHRPALEALDAALLERLGEGMADWPDTDTFAPYLAGVAWREGQIGDEVIHRWARSEDRWWRRAALVSTVALNIKARGGSGDASRTLAVCELLADDGDDMVVKALSWALRSLVQSDAEAEEVRAFLEEHDDVLAARVKREVRNKLETGLKNPRRSAA